MNVLNQSSQIELFRLKTLAQAIKLEMRGMKRRGQSATQIARQTLGINTRSRKGVLDALNNKIKERENNA